MLFPALLPLAAAGWVSAAPAPTPPPTVAAAAEVAVTEAARLAADNTVSIVLHDVNHRETRVVRVGRDGTVDELDRLELERLFRCKRTGRHHHIDPETLAMLADVADHYAGHTIEFVSGYRATDRRSSRHRQGRAIDFRVLGVRTTEVRDYIWANHTGLGLGWYPHHDFLHMDHRPGVPDYAWTQVRGHERGNPSWSRRVRRGETVGTPSHRVGL